MRPDTGGFLPNEGELLSRLYVNATDAARICGVTVRQLTYWTDRGIVATREGDARTYDEQALRKVLAIKDQMLQGYTLEKAAQLTAVSTAGDSAEQQVEPAYLERLSTAVEAFAPRVKAYLALGRARRATAALTAAQLEPCFGDGAEVDAVARRIAAVLDEVTFVAETALAEVSGPRPAAEGAAEGALTVPV
ncbi:MAG: MerR family transcriptional regulator [Chloroflexota bacterium]